MKLMKILNGINHQILSGNLNIEINNIQYNSHQINKGDLFCCLNGTKTDGHKYIQEAINKGATTIVIDKNIDLDTHNNNITYIKTDNNRIALSIMAKNFYNNADERIKLIGITGTNGKTTTTYFLKSILENAGYKCGLIGTIANYIGNERINTKNTTPESLELQKLFSEMIAKDCEYCIMEVSSHSIAMNRVHGIHFDIALFTNLTIDHQDYHTTMDNYFSTKMKLLENSDYVFINTDCNYGKKATKLLNEKNIKYSTYSITNNSDYIIDKIEFNNNTNKFTINNTNYTISLPGKYNVYNATGAILISQKLGVSNEKINEGIKINNIEGRYQCLKDKYNLDFEIIIDFAHTPDGLKNLLETARIITKKNLISVYGCGGDKDKIKRAELGKVGTELSDMAIITSDNPRDESPLNIIKDIVHGIKKKNYIIEENRKNAIKKAIKLAQKGDTIILAGKGHEKVQLINSKTIPFNEEQIVLECLKEINKPATLSENKTNL